MLISMTGYGRTSVSSKYGKFTIEIQSLNRKFLESFLVIPKELLRFEIEIKQWIAEKIRRGQVTVRITRSMETKDVGDLLPDETVLSKLFESWTKTAKKLKLDASQINIPFLANQSQLLFSNKDFKDEEAIRKVLKKGINTALDEMLEMKQKEGTVLAKDILKRLKYISLQIQLIEKCAPTATTRFKERLLQKINEFIESDALDDRVLKEVAIYSDKIDITEEILRFKSHIDQFNSILQSIEAVGRKMDFLIQEMMREINTIASKSSEAAISKSVIEVKTELERIREQVQNVE